MLYAFLYPLFLLWALIYVADRLLKRRGQRSRLALPIHASSDSLHVVLKPFHLVIDTKILNPAHDKFSVYLYKKQSIHNVLRTFYNVGNLFGVLGMLSAIGLLGWTSVKLLYVTLHDPQSVAHTLVRRSTPPAELDMPFHLIASVNPSP
jgi:S2P endopeptidase